MTFEELFFKLTRLQRAGIVGVFCVLLLVLFWFLVVSDMRAKINSLQKQIGRIKIEIINQEKRLRQGPALKRKLKALKEDLQSMVASLPEKQEIEQLLKKITDLLSESALVAKRFVPGKESINEQLYYATIPISLNVTGDFQKQGTFFASLHDLPRIVNVPRIALKKGGASGREGELAKKLDLVPLEATISAVTYRRLTPQEIKAIAAKKQARGKKRGRRRR